MGTEEKEGGDEEATREVDQGWWIIAPSCSVFNVWLYTLYSRADSYSRLRTVQVSYFQHRSNVGSTSINNIDAAILGKDPVIIVYARVAQYKLYRCKSSLRSNQD